MVPDTNGPPSSAFPAAALAIFSTAMTATWLAATNTSVQAAMRRMSRSGSALKSNRSRQRNPARRSAGARNTTWMTTPAVVPPPRSRSIPVVTWSASKNSRPSASGTASLV